MKIVGQCNLLQFPKSRVKFSAAVKSPISKMPRGGGRGPKKNYKGKSRHFTDEENLKEAAEKEKREKQWRRQRGEADSDDEDGAEGGAEGVTKATKDNDSSSDSGSSSDEDDKHKGVSHLIDIENPNRNANKTVKISNVDTKAAGPELSRREREEIAKQRAAENYQKLHKEGKTEEARNDLARLQIIRKQREEAAKKREAERLAKEEADKS